MAYIFSRLWESYTTLLLGEELPSMEGNLQDTIS
jgi:hypothetical protein